MTRLSYLGAWLAVLSFSTMAAAGPPTHRTRHVIFVMTDGLRWQEVFRGADPALIDQEHGGVADVPALKSNYWRETPEDRRQALLPFFWTVMARQGQVYGNRDAGSDAFVTNGMNFSYPGYSETLCGFADARIDSNGEQFNPNVTMLEWLHRKSRFRGSVAAFGAWYLFPWILNAPRAGFPINAGWEPSGSSRPSRELALLDDLKRETPRIWDDEAFDSLTFHAALEYLKREQPAVLFISLGETDVWGHERNYPNYLQAARRVDDYLRRLWNTVQSIPEYRGSTTLVFTPDHGRGDSPDHWGDHGLDFPQSKYIWMAFLGPDTRPLGMRANIEPVTQSQVAATIASLLGEDYRREVPNAGAAIDDVVAASAPSHAAAVRARERRASALDGSPLY